MADWRESMDVRVRFTVEPLSALRDLEADVCSEDLLVDGLYEALELPCIEGDLTGSMG
jgi:hypothetical protein